MSDPDPFRIPPLPSPPEPATTVEHGDKELHRLQANLARNLKARMLKLGWVVPRGLAEGKPNTQRLAMEARISWQNTARVLAGKQWPSPEVLERLAQAVGMAESDLIADE